MTYVEAANGEEALEVIRASGPKVVVSDWQMNSMDGLELLRQIRGSAVCSNIYFVMLTSRTDREGKMLAFRQGVDDYLTKPVDRWELLGRMRVGLRMWECQHRLREAAVTDGLTGLFNQDHISTLLDAELNRARRLGTTLSVIMFDLDFFKAINDTHGPLAGNEVLVRVADVLRTTVRDFDTIGRFAGEEFIVIAPGACLEEGRNLAERIRLTIAESVVIEGDRGCGVTASAGVACCDDARVRVAAGLVELADRARYIAKDGGRDRVATAAEVSEDAEGRLLVQSKEVPFANAWADAYPKWASGLACRETDFGSSGLPVADPPARAWDLSLDREPQVNRNV